MKAVDLPNERTCLGFRKMRNLPQPAYRSWRCPQVQWVGGEGASEQGKCKEVDRRSRQHLRLVMMPWLGPRKAGMSSVRR